MYHQAHERQRLLLKHVVLTVQHNTIKTGLYKCPQLLFTDITYSTIYH